MTKQQKYDPPNKGWEDHFQKIKDDYEKALEYQSTDKNMALSKARYIAENICFQLVKRETSYDPTRLPLNALIGKLIAAKAVSSYILAPLRAVQYYGNLGAHYQGENKEIPLEYVHACIYSLFGVISRYFETYWPEGQVTIPFPVSTINEEEVNRVETFQKTWEAALLKEFSPTESHLRVFEKTPDGQQLRLTTNSHCVTIGRSPKSDIQLNNQTVSWEHGNILFTEHEYIYRHVSKTNPTYIKRHNEQFLLRQDVKTELPLKNNDRIVIGGNVLIVQFNVYAELEGYTTTERKPP